MILSSGIAGWAQSHLRETIWLILFPYLQLFYKFTNDHYASYTIALYVQLSMTQQVHNFVCWEKLGNIIQVTIQTTWCRSVSTLKSVIHYLKLVTCYLKKRKRNLRILCTDYCTEFTITSNFRIWRLWCFAAITPQTVALIFSIF